jgi:hypothetical protein
MCIFKCSCGSRKVKIESFCNCHYVICINCKNTTENCTSPEMAVLRWNQKIDSISHSK